MVIAIVGVIFVNWSKEFGGNPSEQKIAAYSKAENYNAKDKKFENLIPTSMDMSFNSVVSTMIEFIKGKDALLKRFHLLKLTHYK